MWALVSHTSNLPLHDRQLRVAAPEELHAVVTDCVADWRPALRKMITQSDIAATFPVHIRSAQSVEPWRTGNITLLGDAIHTMTSAGGIGANTALRDAELLSQKLTEVARGEKALMPALHEYEAAMLRYGFEAVHHSRHQLGMVYKNLLPSQPESVQ
jgi:2-polyprenyl-6-methoxyphenol hydroxylase-like FAD-dependent oxidoreductase